MLFGRDELLGATGGRTVRRAEQVTSVACIARIGSMRRAGSEALRAHRAIDLSTGGGSVGEWAHSLEPGLLVDDVEGSGCAEEELVVGGAGDRDDGSWCL